MSNERQVLDRDAEMLRNMGYKQELARAMSGFSNFAISFTIISVLSGCLTLFGYGLTTSGTTAATIGWPIVSILVLSVALAMAEIASAYPTAGGLYFWASKLGGPGWGWFTAWFNLIGQIAVTAGINYGMAGFVDALLNQFFPVVPATPIATLIIYAVIMLLQTGLNFLGVNFVSFINSVSAWWHIVGVLLIAGGLYFFAPLHPHTTHFLFTTNTSSTGFPNWYGFLLGLLLAQYTFTGFDASAHVSEETVGADRSAPRGIIMSVVISAVAGYILLMALTAAIPDMKATMGASNPVLYILTTRLGSTVGTTLFIVAVVAQFYCGTASITSNSRMIYAFARDKGMPLSRVWHKINKETHVPKNAIWLAVGLAFILALPALFSTVVYAAVTSISTIGLFVAYVIPVYLRLRNQDKFQRGVFHLGKWSNLIGWFAVVWVVFICVLFMLPQANPVTFANFNFTPVVFLVIFAWLIIWYLSSVRKWFKGPISEFQEANRTVDNTVVGQPIGTTFSD
ncbi:MAG: amino acid permease [Alicyclobacillus sp. RIFOXYA1_FULL_53_8]|nr:MAG: amino acid permease [Alicyclobacillus sp. RIFOXYA1_FULL_53_8]